MFINKAKYQEIIAGIFYRMFPETFEIVLQIIGPGLRAINALPGRKPISPEKQLLIAIWFMSTPDSYRYVSPYIKILLL